MPAFPTSLQTERLTLRFPADATGRVEHEMILESLDHLWPWFSFRADPPSLAQRTELAARQRADAIAGKTATYLVSAGDEPVGKVWLELGEAKTATIGWWLRLSATGQGYATEAVRALTQ